MTVTPVDDRRDERWRTRPRRIPADGDDEVMILRALVVDDERNIVDLLTDLLEGELGLQVLRAYDGQSAFETYERAQPDLVIADIMMPRLDGLTLATMLQERFKTPNIILMSAAVTPRTGEFAYIAKPFDIDEMLTLVCRLLAMPSLDPISPNGAASAKPDPG